MSIAKKPGAAVALAVLIAAASFIVALIAVSRVVAADYRFTRIVDSTMVEPDAFMLATIRYAYDFNNAGTVVFHANGNQGPQRNSWVS
ncbi:MAG: hypothetical protein DCC67_15930 [Planctomycetota bacterium]|nr:MAG: hypothetical protein DCC67_15930 [Planctomycetota bacterium]